MAEVAPGPLPWGEGSPCPPSHPRGSRQLQEQGGVLPGAGQTPGLQPVERQPQATGLVQHPLAPSLYGRKLRESIK